MKFLESTFCDLSLWIAAVASLSRNDGKRALSARNDWERALPLESRFLSLRDLLGKARQSTLLLESACADMDCHDFASAKSRNDGVGVLGLESTFLFVAWFLSTLLDSKIVELELGLCESRKEDKTWWSIDAAR